MREATSDIALHYLAKYKIMIIKEVERPDIDFAERTLNCQRINHIDHFTADKLGSAALAEEVNVGGYIKDPTRYISDAHWRKVCRIICHPDQ